MPLAELLRVALEALRVNLMRSVLTMLGIIIGVAAVIAMVTVGAGAQAEIDRQISSLGSNLFMVMSGARSRGGVRSASGSEARLTVADARALKAEIPEIIAAAPTMRGVAQVVVGNTNWSTTIQGIDNEYLVARGWQVDEGRDLEPQEIRSGGKVALLGSRVATELFGAANALGQTVRIKNVPFVVVGTLLEKGQSSMGSDQDDIVMIPLEAARGRVLGRSGPRSDTVSVIFVSVAEGWMMDDVERQMAEVLRQRHRVRAGADDPFAIRNMSEIVETRAEARQVFNMLLAAVASVSLVVGGIGIMNIMLVSVTERTREIGLRMAVGAKGRDILLQFLVEAVTLCLIGGVLGILCALVITFGIARVAEWPVLLQWPVVVLALGFSAAIGIFFGFYPARKAAAKDPIEALRTE